MFTALLDTLLFFTVTTPGISLLARRIRLNRLVEAYTILGFSTALIFLTALYSEVSSIGVVSSVSGSASSFPVGVYIEVDALSVFMAFIYILIGFSAAIYSMKYMEGQAGLTIYYTLLLGITSGMIGVVVSGGLFTLYIFWEIMCLCSYALVAFRKESWEPVEAGYKYLIMSGAGSLTILYAMALLYGLTGTLNIALLSEAISRSAGGPWIYLALTMLIAGFGLQAGMVPLHTWLPDAHSAAPSPVSAVLSGAMVMTGVYGLLRTLSMVFYPYSGAWQMALSVFSIATMFTGNLMALLQDNLKRLLAYSTVANIGYILLGLASNSVVGLTGSLFQILNHAVVKALLFLCTGSYIRQLKTRSLKELAGIGRKMTVTSSLFIIGLIALSGVPPLNLFWSEWTILSASLESGIFMPSILMAANLVLSAAYCLRVIQNILLKGGAKKSIVTSEAPASMLMPEIVLATLSIIIGVYPGPFREAAEEAARAALNIEAYVNILR